MKTYFIVSNTNWLPNVLLYSGNTTALSETFLYKYAFSLKYAANVSDSLMCNQGFESRWMSVELVCYIKIIIILIYILRLLLLAAFFGESTVL